MTFAAKIVRFFSVIAIFVILTTAYQLFIRPSQLRLGATNEEVRRTMRGDDLVAHPTFVATRAITIRGRPEQTWPWLVQMLTFCGSR